MNHTSGAPSYKLLAAKMAAVNKRIQACIFFTQCLVYLCLKPLSLMLFDILPYESPECRLSNTVTLVYIGDVWQEISAVKGRGDSAGGIRSLCVEYMRDGR